MTPNPVPLKNDVKAMQILCGALIAGVVIFSLVIIGLHQVMEEPVIAQSELPDKNIFLYAAAGFGVLGLIAAITLYNKRVAAARAQASSVSEKLASYRATLIIYMALCEGPALLSVIVLFLTKQYIVLAVTAVMLAAMISKMPTRKKVIDALQLDWQQQQELE